MRILQPLDDLLSGQRGDGGDGGAFRRRPEPLGSHWLSARCGLREIPPGALPARPGTPGASHIPQASAVARDSPLAL